MKIYELLENQKISNILNKPTLTPKELANKHGVEVSHILQQLRKGITVELEHTSKRSIAREIALDHLGEDPNYYSKLAKVEKNVEEGWKEKALGLAGAASMYAGLNAMPAPGMQRSVEPTAQVQQVAQPEKPAQPVAKKEIAKPQPKIALQTDNIAERALYDIAVREGIKGTELAQFMAQCKHESWDFEKMHEIGSIKKLAKKYAVHPELGNRGYKDAARYIGRGPMQITGRENYKNASRYLFNKFQQEDPEFLESLPGGDNADFLLHNPQLMADPTIGAHAAVWYWKSRVRPNVQSFDDTKSVTRQINPAMRGLDRRQANFQAYHGDDQG